VLVRSLVAALGAAALLAACAASVPVQRLASMQELDYGGAERFVDLSGRRGRDGLRVAYEVHGPAAGPVVLFIHPWAGNMRVWDAVAPRFAVDHRVVLLDLPGHGKSAKPRVAYDIELAAKAVAGLIAHLELQGVTLVGNSLGGGVALAVARDHPERLERLVLIDALGGGPVPGLFSFFIERFFTPPMFHGVDDGLIELFADWIVFSRSTRWTDGFLSLMLSSRASGEGYAFSYAVATYLTSAVAYDATPWLGRIVMPTHIVWGADDLVIWPGAGEHLRAHIPGATLSVLDDCGHMPEVECPDALLAVLQRLLNGAPGSVK
jgi:pimeloyl-ACP methyl ester carboxylesterase